MKRLVYIWLLLIGFASQGQNELLFKEGNSFYNEGNYTAALEKYKMILDSGEHSSELYFNIANAHYKLNHVAPSIYYYEKALLLDPNDKDIKNNIAFARNMTVDAIDTLPEVGLTKLISNVTNALSFDGWAKVAVGLIIIFVMVFIAYDYTNTTGKKRLAFLVSNAALLTGIVAVIIAFHKYNLDQNNRPAIVFAQETKIKSEPNLRSSEAFMLHEGTKVQVLDEVDDWKKVQLSDGKVGWIMSEDIKLIKNF